MGGGLDSASMRRLAGCLLFFLAACEPSFVVVDREADDRTPLSAECDALDDARCFLPWPSNTFTVSDPSSPTGLRVSLNAALINRRDDASAFARADGFSRVSPVLTAFDAPLDESTIEGAIQLVLMQHDHPDRLRSVVLRTETIAIEGGTTLLVGDPRALLEPNADYAVIVTDALRHADGSVPSRSRGTDVALGAVPRTEEEAAIAGYNAPLRRLIEELELDPTQVVRAWSFTTRSAENPRAPLVVARTAALAATVGVAIDQVTVPEDARIAMIVTGRLTGLPSFLDAEHRLVVGASLLPEQTGSTEAPFRVMVPAGSGDYRFVMFGHGTGGSHFDAAFDGDIAGLGAAKVGVRIYGWTDTDVLRTFANLANVFDGSFAAASQIVEALAHAAAIQQAMSGVLADTLSADTIASMPNPAAGRRPDASIPMWVGGSLGGTTGLIYASADPEVRHAILNVPGAAWCQWVWDSYTFTLLRELLRVRYEDDIDLFTAITISQTNFDMADGASWADVLVEHPTAFLIQESIGDPVLPNQGTEMVVRTIGAPMVGGAIDPIPNVESVPEVIEGSAITQFRTADTGEFAIHGFADRDGPAGEAARAQILEVLESTWAGSSRIVLPSTCVESCDFGL